MNEPKPESLWLADVVADAERWRKDGQHAFNGSCVICSSTHVVVANLLHELAEGRDTTVPLVDVVRISEECRRLYRELSDERLRSIELARRLAEHSQTEGR